MWRTPPIRITQNNQYHQSPRNLKQKRSRSTPDCPVTRRACDQHTKSHQKLQEGTENVWKTRMAAPHQDHQRPRDPPQPRHRNPSVAADRDVILLAAGPRPRRRPYSPSHGLERGPSQVSHVQHHPPVGSIIAACTSSMPPRAGSSLSRLGLPTLIDLPSMPPKKRHQGISRSVGSSVKTRNGPTLAARVAGDINTDPDLSREILHSCNASPNSTVMHSVGAPDSEQLLKVMVNSIRQMPVFLHREGSKPAQWFNREIVVQRSQLDRSDVTLKRERNRIIFGAAGERVPNHVLSSRASSSPS